MQPAYSIHHERRHIGFFHTEHAPASCKRQIIAKTIDWEIFTHFIKSDMSQLCCISDDPESAFHRFSTFFYPLEAAGGLVVNAAQKWLFIYRNGIWDLPKGVIEPGEKPGHAAIREVEEECGIAGLKIIKNLPNTYHIYTIKNKKWIIKKTHWFLMILENDQPLNPQTSEGITSAEWRNPYKVDDIRENTFGSINQLLDHCLLKKYANQSRQE